jgi:hypothetical protein
MDLECREGCKWHLGKFKVIFNKELGERPDVT